MTRGVQQQRKKNSIKQYALEKPLPKMEIGDCPFHHTSQIAGYISEKPLFSFKVNVEGTPLAPQYHIPAHNTKLNLNYPSMRLPFFGKRSVYDDAQSVTNEKSSVPQHDTDLERGQSANYSDGVSVDQIANGEQEHKRSRWTGGVSVKNRKVVRIFGQIGFCAKGMVYG
jgi:hypothetical protein